MARRKYKADQWQVWLEGVQTRQAKESGESPKYWLYRSFSNFSRATHCYKIARSDCRKADLRCPLGNIVASWDAARVIAEASEHVWHMLGGKRFDAFLNFSDLQ